ncbi:MULTISPECIES: hypothetical protein [unclassified Sphingomonas]|uniref:hypothetical protein n=1 Tax=unclassified Sphingomonas TaxID=196159 RepID=UPI000701F61C|nr:MULTISPECIES: hypothetical protein [unclassified Sphingomonas]KQX19997.1 hypothetical protein ASD17_08785 [Sphingomonas sp. Root1294]KQY67246.1 hypothetical protein ASD39_08840 [Sphingomonas sp. Root50]KRB90619.1 hypothetical protein ASE22_09850 [Sphingomonas sp. Root720]
MTIKSKAGAAGAEIKQRATRAGDFASETIRTGGEAARTAGRRAVEGVESFPVAALLGGLAVGVAIGALLPRTRQEEELLGTIGGTINDRAKDAVNAARDAGQAKLDELGISTDAAGKQVGRLIDSLAQVAESAGSAAVDSVRH